MSSKSVQTLSHFKYIIRLDVLKCGMCGLLWMTFPELVVKGLNPFSDKKYCQTCMIDIKRIKSANVYPDYNPFDFNEWCKRRVDVNSFNCCICKTNINISHKLSRHPCGSVKVLTLKTYRKHQFCILCFSKVIRTRSRLIVPEGCCRRHPNNPNVRNELSLYWTAPRRHTTV